uniref:Uncharacterized protein n=1 Tax=Macrostomum lignano TaxID=282301 RepID=A0A1I8I859_9PLAT
MLQLSAPGQRHVCKIYHQQAAGQQPGWAIQRRHGPPAADEQPNRGCPAATEPAHQRRVTSQRPVPRGRAEVFRHAG